MKITINVIIDRDYKAMNDYLKHECGKSLKARIEQEVNIFLNKTREQARTRRAISSDISEIVRAFEQWVTGAE